MKFDAIFGVRSLREVPAVARAAESLGFDGLWTSEIQHDPLLPGALIAEHTQQIEFGTSITVSFARSPGTMAYTAWDLAEASGGRFILGLGTQVKAHIQRRFGMPWPESPVKQLREQIQVLRAFWNSWQHGAPLNHRGEYYKITLMTPFFNPGAIENPAIPIYIAGVNTGLARLAGEAADGFHVHPFHTRRYLEEVLLPAIQAGARQAGRSRAEVVVNVSTFFATNAREKEFARQQISFYASTPSYRAVMALHGWESTAEALSALAARGRWEEMPGLIDDVMLDTFAVSAAEADLPAAMAARYRGLADRLSIYTPFVPGQRDALWRAMIRAAHA
ncbi:MAG: TIGR03617 family F420-dependent LLM class oxidoreductase [Anaerolineales bacterium]|jgi:probable F420-dependent oxidoreductase